MGADQTGGNEMIEVTVTTKTRNLALTATVVLPNPERLTPIAARAATEVAFGVGTHATVSDGEIMYRVTKSGIRRLKAEY